MFVFISIQSFSFNITLHTCSHSHIFNLRIYLLLCMLTDVCIVSLWPHDFFDPVQIIGDARVNGWSITAAISQTE